MPQSRSRRGSPEVFDFDGDGDEARAWLDRAYGTPLRVTGPMGRVRQHRVDHGTFAFDHVAIDARFAFDADPLPTLVVVDMIDGDLEYTRDDVTTASHDGDSVLVAGWDMPFSGRSNAYEIRTTSITAAAVIAAVHEVVPHYPWERIAFSSYVPHSPAAGARWRAIVDQISSLQRDDDPEEAVDNSARLLGHTLLETFPNNVVTSGERLEVDTWAREATPSTVRNAVRLIEGHAFEGITPADLAEECGVSLRTLQYAFRRELGCTPLDYIRRVRLDLVRQALRDGSTVAVSEAAAKYGFHNPGRFASDYRQVFDENPGQTLQRSTP